MASTDARPVPRKNTAFRVTFPLLDGSADLVTGATSLDSEVSIDGGTFADCTNEATEIATSSGMYFLDLTSGEMNGDTVAVIVKSADAKTTTLVFYPEEAGDFRADTTHWGGTAVASANVLIDGAITADKIASDAITAAKVAADVTTELQSGLATSSARSTAQADLDILTGADGAVIASGTQTFNMTGNITGNLSGSVGSVTGAINTAAGTITTLDALDTAQDSQHAQTQSDIAALNDPTAGAIADAVWTELIADHSGISGSTAEALAAAGSAGDPWATALPGSYTSGQAGKIIGDNINATISSRASQTSVDDLPTNAELATALGTADDAILAVLGAPIDGDLATDIANVQTAVDAVSVPSANANADALLDRADAVETGLTVRQSLRLQSAVLGGTVSGAQSGFEVFKNAVANDTTRVSVNADPDGNRTTVTTNL